MCSAKSKGNVRGSCYESAKSNPPISGLKLSNKVDKSCATDDRVCPRGYPPPPGMAADKCISLIHITVEQ